MDKVGLGWGFFSFVILVAFGALSKSELISQFSYLLASLIVGIAVAILIWVIRKAKSGYSNMLPKTKGQLSIAFGILWLGVWIFITVIGQIKNPLEFGDFIGVFLIIALPGIALVVKGLLLMRKDSS